MRPLLAHNSHRPVNPHRTDTKLLVSLQVVLVVSPPYTHLDSFGTTSATGHTDFFCRRGSVSSEINHNAALRMIDSAGYLEEVEDLRS